MIQTYSLTVTVPRPCARVRCRKLIYKRLSENERAFQGRRFCSFRCSGKVNGWGKMDLAVAR